MIHSFKAARTYRSIVTSDLSHGSATPASMADVCTRCPPRRVLPSSSPHSTSASERLRRHKRRPFEQPRSTNAAHHTPVWSQMRCREPAIRRRSASWLVVKRRPFGRVPRGPASCGRARLETSLAALPCDLIDVTLLSMSAGRLWAAQHASTMPVDESLRLFGRTRFCPAQPGACWAASSFNEG